MGIHSNSLIALLMFHAGASPIYSKPIDESIRPFPVSSSLTEVIDQCLHAAKPAAGGLGHSSFHNPSNGLNACTTPQGLALNVSIMVDGKPRQHFAHWRTTSFGYGRFRAPVSEGEVHAVKESSRVEIRHPGLVEWFVNTSHGLEHGYTLPDRPRGEERGAPLRVTLALDGDLLAEDSVDGLHYRTSSFS